jgi:spore coat protein U-like protein
MTKHIAKLLLAGVAASVMAAAAHAATATSQFNAQITIQADCQVLSPNTLDFGTHGLLNSNIDATVDFTVQCTNGVSYTIAMDDGANASGSTNRMKNGTEYVNYEIYQDASRSTVWDATSTVSGTGNGNQQTYTVYGRVPPQTTPSAGTYIDTVTITVSY